MQRADAFIGVCFCIIYPSAGNSTFQIGGIMSNARVIEEGFKERISKLTIVELRNVTHGLLKTVLELDDKIAAFEGKIPYNDTKIGFIK